MIITLSPSKGQDFDSPAPISSQSQPVSLAQSEMLVEALRNYDIAGVKSLMSVSDNIAALNVERFQRFSTPFTQGNAKPAIYAFKGDVYGGLGAEVMTEDDMQFAQQHVRILSGLYGRLRPLDLIQPYRLEMKTRLANPQGKDLYEFWGNQITDLLNEDLATQKDATLINLASNEYWKSVKPKVLNGRVLQVNFKEEKDGKARILAVFAKRARGLMTNYIIKNRIEVAEEIKAFDWEGYRFNTELSDDKQWTFTRPQPEKKS